MITAIALIALIILLLSLLIGASYNGFVHRKNALQYAYQGLDVQLQKRHELLPQLAEIVQASAQFEFKLIAETNKWLSGGSPKALGSPALQERENKIARSILQLTREINRDAALRQQKSFVHLQQSITEVEAQISAARRAYNAAAMEYNNAIEMFPTVLFATLSGMKRVDTMDLLVIESDYIKLDR